MASIVTMIGGVLINAAACWRKLSRKVFEEEKQRHDLAVEKYQAAYKSIKKI